jgi:hypothetical protein
MQKHVTRSKKSTHKSASKAASGTGSGTPKTLRIPITNVFDGNDYSAQILIGSQQIAANVILDTGSSTLAVVPSVYQAAKDAGMTPTSLAQQVQYGTGAWLGPVVNTSMVIGDPEGATVALKNAPIAITVTQSKGDFTGVDGIMGLAYLSLNSAFDLKAYLTQQKVNPPDTFPWPFPSANFNQAWNEFIELVKAGDAKPTSIDPYFMELEDQGMSLNKFAFYTLRSWVRMATNNKTAIANDPLNNGFFILGGGEEQTDLYTGNFVNVDVLHDVYYNVNLISTQVGNQPAVKADPLQAQYARTAFSNCIVDTGTNPLVLANDVFQAVIQSLDKVSSKFISLIQQAAKDGISSSLLNLAEWPDITFTLTGDTGNPVKLTCSPQTYWQQDFPGPGKSICQLNAAGSDDPVNQTILGLPLMNNYYSVFDRSQGSGNGIIRFASITQP